MITLAQEKNRKPGDSGRPWEDGWVFGLSWGGIRLLGRDSVREKWSKRNEAIASGDQEEIPAYSDQMKSKPCANCTKSKNAPFFEGCRATASRSCLEMRFDSRFEAKATGGNGLNPSWQRLGRLG